MPTSTKSNGRVSSTIACFLIFALSILVTSSVARAAEPGLVGNWKLVGDCRDHSGQGLHAVNHGVDLETGRFTGRGAYLEIPDAEALRFGKSDFTVTAEVNIAEQLDDVIGDLVSKFDPATRKGFTVTVNSSAGGYNSSSNSRHLFFGTDADTKGNWINCGRPGGLSHNSDALTVFDGQLYAGISDAPTLAGWAHVYRYKGADQWEDCGRLGDGKTRGSMRCACTTVHFTRPHPPVMVRSRQRWISVESIAIGEAAIGTIWVNRGQTTASIHSPRMVASFMSAASISVPIRGMSTFLKKMELGAHAGNLRGGRPRRPTVYRLSAR